MELTAEHLVTTDDRALFAIRTPSLATWPAALGLPSRYFACLVVADGTAESTDQLGAWADRVLGQGMAFCASWGPGCEVVEDIVDWTILQRNQFRVDVPLIITTSHSRDPLPAAIDFFLNAAPLVAEEYRARCRSWLLVEDGEFGRRCGCRQLLLEHVRHPRR